MCVAEENGMSLKTKDIMAAIGGSLIRLVNGDVEYCL